MINEHLYKLLGYYKQAAASSLSQYTVKDEMYRIALAIDRAYVKKEDSTGLKEYYEELKYLLYNVIGNEHA